MTKLMQREYCHRCQRPLAEWETDAMCEGCGMMTMNTHNMDLAIAAIDRLFEDRSVAVATTREKLIELRELIDIKIELLADEED